MTVQQAFELAVQHHRAGRLAEAEALYRQVLAAHPLHATAFHHLGLLAHRAGRHAEAVDYIRRSLALAPENVNALANLGEVFRSMGRLEEAASCLEEALSLAPQDAVAFYNLGNVRRDQGRTKDSIAAFRKALELQPDYPEAYNNLGVVLKRQGHLEEALAAFRAALEFRPGYIDASCNLGNTFRAKNQPDDAVAAYQQVLAAEPAHLDALNNLGDVLFHQARHAEAIATYRRALEFHPSDAALHSNLILVSQYLSAPEAELTVREQARWNLAFAEPARRFIQPHNKTPDAERRLRIGYVSADLRRHVTGRYLKPLFENHDHTQFEIICYSGTKNPDDLTDQLRRCAEHWHEVAALPDDALAEVIRRDGVDILVDLSQHTAGNRLPVFARQPAPVQVSFGGSPAGTGVPTIHYRISDKYLEPGPENRGLEPGWNPESDPKSRLSERGDRPAEQVFSLHSFWCYDPCGAEVPISPLPVGRVGTMTFGSLNNFGKLNERLLKVWASVLAAVPNARLLLLASAGSHRRWASGVFESAGVAPQRIEFATPRPHQEYLQLYNELDVALDPFPYNGHTTSLDALWMGVPVVSLRGERSVARAGLSQLSNLGLPELVASSEEDYTKIAVELATDLPRLAELRRTLRHRMTASRLMDAPCFARSIEAAYREMWRDWCFKTLAK